MATDSTYAPYSGVFTATGISDELVIGSTDTGRIGDSVYMHTVWNESSSTVHTTASGGNPKGLTMDLEYASDLFRAVYSGREQGTCEITPQCVMMLTDENVTYIHRIALYMHITGTGPDKEGVAGVLWEAVADKDLPPEQHLQVSGLAEDIATRVFSLNLFAHSDWSSMNVKEVGHVNKQLFNLDLGEQAYNLFATVVSGGVHDRVDELLRSASVNTIFGRNALPGYTASVQMINRYSTRAQIPKARTASENIPYVAVLNKAYVTWRQEGWLHGAAIAEQREREEVQMRDHLALLAEQAYKQRHKRAYGDQMSALDRLKQQQIDALYRQNLEIKSAEVANSLFRSMWDNVHLGSSSKQVKK